MPPVVAAVKTREVMWQMPVWAEVLWYLLAAASVLVFLYGVARPIAKYRRGRADGCPARHDLARRFGTATRELLGHRRIGRRDPYAGWAHAAIFYGFLTLFIGTVILAINSDVTEPLFGWRFFQGDFYLVYSVALDLLGMALIVGVLLMMVRRAILRPPKLDYARPDRDPDDPAQSRGRYRTGDWVFVGALLYLAVTGFMLEGVRIAIDHPGYNGFSPIGWVAGEGFAALGAGDGTLGTLRHLIWWSHGLVALAFVASIPYTKAVHMLTSFVSLALRDPMAGKRLPPIPPERATEPAGYGALSDFSSLHLLELDACTKCGKCHAACPATATGMPLSPRDVILELREQANGTMADVGIGGVLGALVRGSDDARAREAMDGPVIATDRIREQTVWSCMQCNACVDVCPVGIEQAPIILQMRRRLVEDGGLDAGLQDVLQVVHKSGNSFGESRRKRGRWTRELDFEVPDARAQPVDILWFVGDYASFESRAQLATRALARLLHRAGVDFGLLYDGECNAGNDVRRIGEEGLFEALAEENRATLAGCEFNRILTSDPHSLNTLRNEYPDLGGGWQVIHHTGLLVELLEAGRLDLSAPLPYRVTYHDPCHLGRMNGEYDAPRRILELLGCELVEMPRNRDNSFCCGAGGGRIWIADEPGAERPSENRIIEATALGELDYFVVSCPKDVVMYEDAIKTTGGSSCLELREIAELVEEAQSMNAEAVLHGPPGRRDIESR